MSRTTQLIPELEPGSSYTPEYHEFFVRLRRARIERGLSLSDMAELVGLHLKSAYDFENLLMPLPFEWLETWCQVVGVPFDDYLEIYWAMEEADFQKQEREAAQKEAAHNALCITNTEAPAPSSASVSRGGDWLSPLLSEFARIRDRLLSRFSTPQ